MEITAINILFGCSFLMLLGAALFIAAALRAEKRDNRNARALSKLILQEAETLSSQLHKHSVQQAKDLKSFEWRITQQIQLMARANQPNLPTKLEVEQKLEAEHREIMKFDQADAELQPVYHERHAA